MLGKLLGIFVIIFVIAKFVSHYTYNDEVYFLCKDIMYISVCIITILLVLLAYTALK